jgi:DNA invertase Pin-like site-specific DNA recombinase
MAKRRKSPEEKETDSDVRLIGYARVSTEDQDLRMQVAALKDYGVDPHYIFHDKLSGKNLKRPGLQEALHIVREGDIFVAWSLDRIGRSLSDLILVSEHIGKRGAQIHCIRDGFDTKTAMGGFYFHLMAALAELERRLIAERTAAGISAKKREGAKFGRQKLLTPKQVEKAVAWRRLHIETGGKRGKTVPQIAVALGASVVTVRTAMLEATGGEKLWKTGPHAGKRRKRKSYRWVETEN